MFTDTTIVISTITNATANNDDDLIVIIIIISEWSALESCANDLWIF